MLSEPTSRMSLLRSSAVPQCAGAVGLDVAWSLVVDVLTTFDTNVEGIAEVTARLALLIDAVDTEGVPAGGGSKVLELVSRVVLVDEESKPLELVARVVLLKEERVVLLKEERVALLGNTVCTETVLLVGGESKLLELVARVVPVEEERVVLFGNTVCTETVVLVGEESKLLELVAKVVLLVNSVVSIGVDDAMEDDVASVLFTAAVVVVAVPLRSSVDAEDAALTVLMAEVVLADVKFRAGKVVDSKGIEDGDVTAVMTRLELTGDVTAGVAEMLVPLAAGAVGDTDGVGELVTLIVEEDAAVVRTTMLVWDEVTPEVVGELLPVAEVKVVVRVRVMMTGGALAVPLGPTVLELETPGATTDVLLRGALPGTV